MPTYEYACGACGHEWEQVQRITEPPVELCPSCKQASAHRLISGGTNFILKGGGWYSDLYASPKAAGKKAEDGASGTTDSSKPATASGSTSEESSKSSSDAAGSEASSSSSSAGSPGTSKPTSAPAST